MGFDERCHVLSRKLHRPQGADNPVLADTFLETGDVLVECIQQGFILAAESLIGIAYHLCRYESLTVTQMLIVHDNLRLDIVKVTVQLQGFLASPLGTVAFRIPQGQRNALLTTALGSAASLVEELALGTIDCNSVHYWHNAVLLLTSVHVEQYRKCASAHVSYSFLNSGCKTTIFSWFCRYAKYSSLRNQKRVVRGASLCPILPVRLTKFNWLQRPSRGLRIRNLTTSLFLPNLHSA